jgi:negative regulator of flagellin synthesis FlgM
MRIPANLNTDATNAAARPASSSNGGAAPARSSGRPSGGGDLQSGVLQPALGAMRDMPEIDEARVAELRDALARGDIPFDAGKLAGLISRYHGTQS